MQILVMSYNLKYTFKLISIILQIIKMCYKYVNL